MFLVFARAIMLVVWSILLINVIKPWPSPVHLFLYFALAFTLVMHSIKLYFLKATQAIVGEKLSRTQMWRFMIFGVLEVLSWPSARKDRLSRPRSPMYPKAHSKDK